MKVMPRFNQKGFAHIILIIVGVVVAAVIFRFVIPTVQIEMERRDPSCTYGDNVILMYGEKPNCPFLKRIDDRFIKAELQAHGGNKRLAIADMSFAGWVYFYKGDYDMAMRRFNQEWLLDPDGLNVYEDFAYLLYKQNKISDADRMIDKAFSLMKETEYQNHHCVFIFQSDLANDKVKMSKQDEFYARIQDHLNKSSQQFDPNKCHVIYGIAYFLMGDNVKAGQEVGLAKQNGEKGEDIQALSYILAGNAKGLSEMNVAIKETQSK